MPDAPPAPGQFWLLTGEVPAGPFTAAQVHAELATGRATWQTPACPVGGTTWLPLVKTPGIGPAAGVSHADITTTGVGVDLASDLPAPPAAPAAFTPRASTPAEQPAPPPAVVPPGERAGATTRAGVLVAILGLVVSAGYGVYEWVRPLTATEVCERADRAKTAAEAKRYATPRMHPLVDALFADKAGSDPNDTSEWTGEVDGPRPDTKLVGMRGTTFVPEAGRRVRVEGHVVMVRSDGWKADDMVITGVEGASLPGPVSLVDEHAREAATAAGRPRTAAGRPATPVPGGQSTGWSPRPFADARPWHERHQKELTGLAVLAVFGAAGAVREWRSRRR